MVDKRGVRAKLSIGAKLLGKTCRELEQSGVGKRFFSQLEPLPHTSAHACFADTFGFGLQIVGRSYRLLKKLFGKQQVDALVERLFGSILDPYCSPQLALKLVKSCKLFDSSKAKNARYFTGFSHKGLLYRFCVSKSDPQSMCYLTYLQVYYVFLKMHALISHALKAATSDGLDSPGLRSEWEATDGLIRSINQVLAGNEVSRKKEPEHQELADLQQWFEMQSDRVDLLFEKVADIERMVGKNLRAVNPSEAPTKETKTQETETLRVSTSDAEVEAHLQVARLQSAASDAEVQTWLSSRSQESQTNRVLLTNNQVQCRLALSSACREIQTTQVQTVDAVVQFEPVNKPADAGVQVAPLVSFVSRELQTSRVPQTDYQVQCFLPLPSTCREVQTTQVPTTNAAVQFDRTNREADAEIQASPSNISFASQTSQVSLTDSQVQCALALTSSCQEIQTIQPETSDAVVQFEPPTFRFQDTQTPSTPTSDAQVQAEPGSYLTVQQIQSLDIAPECWKEAEDEAEATFLGRDGCDCKPLSVKAIDFVAIKSPQGAVLVCDGCQTADVATCDKATWTGASKAQPGLLSRFLEEIAACNG